MLHTGETISGIFYMQDTLFFGIFDSLSSTLAFYDFVGIDPEFKIEDDSATELNPFDIKKHLSCRADYVLFRNSKCRCNQGYYQALDPSSSCHLCNPECQACSMFNGEECIEYSEFTIALNDQLCAVDQELNTGIPFCNICEAENCLDCDLRFPKICKTCRKTFLLDDKGQCVDCGDPA